MNPSSQKAADFKKNNPTHTTTFREYYWGPTTDMPDNLVGGATATTTASITSLVFPTATDGPKAPDQQQDVKSSFKRSIPLIIYMTASIGGTFVIIVLGLLLRKWLKKRKVGKQVEHHEQWLARQNLDREEDRVSRMAFGGYFGRVEGVQGRDFAAERGGGGRFGNGDGMELRTMGRDRLWR